jgi:hypothetical protein
MTTLLRQASLALPRLAAAYPADPRVAPLRRALLDNRPRSAQASAPTFPYAVQSVEDPFYFALFGAITAEIGRHRQSKAELVVVRATSGATGIDWRARVRRSVPMTWILSTQWVRAFAGLADRIAFRSHSWSNPFVAAADAVRSATLWRRARRQEGDLDLDVLGVLVGDLISDTYLRFRPSPRFDASDPFVFRLIRQAHQTVRRARRYFRRAKPAFYLTSYATYVEHGIPVRVALQEGVGVFSFGSLTRFDKRLGLADWYHTNDCDAYPSIFATLDEPERRLAEAEEQLKLRLTGGVDAATSYMKASAYAGAAASVPADLAGAAVVFLHDFYDSPHVYPDIVFGDFWRWASFTIETLTRAGVPFYLKPHPNQVALSGTALDELRARYPGARFLPPDITTMQLAKAGIACGVTVYGTIAHELAYLGIPSVGCAKHPHSAFDFCKTARDQVQYAELLRDARALDADPIRMRREALTFYYMHNLHGSAQELDLRARFLALWKACHDAAAPAAELLDALAALRQAPGFATRVAAIVEGRT